MKTTINQLVQELKDIQDSHLQLNDFFWGDFGKASSRNDLKYPLMCCYYPNGSVLNNLTPINLIVVIADKIDKANNEIGENPTQGNLTEVESDTLQVTRDIYNVINKSRRWQQLARVNSVTFNKFIERGKDETAGHYMTISLYIKDTTSICNLPMEGYNFDQTIPGPVDCDPATVQNSDDTYSVQVSSGGTLTLPDEDITINGSAFLTKPSVQSQNIYLQDQDENPITPSSIVGDVVTVTLPVPPPTGATSTMLMGSGLQTSYRTGDDKSINSGRESGSFFVLDANNPFGNTDRFTDTLGGQAYANDIVLDWARRDYTAQTVLTYCRAERVAPDWDDAIDTALSLSITGFTTGWYLPSWVEMFNLIQVSTGAIVLLYPLTYAPFNLTINTNYWTSTTRPVLTTQALRFFNNSAYAYNPVNKTTGGYSHIYARHTNLTELGL